MNYQKVLVGNTSYEFPEDMSDEEIGKVLSSLPPEETQQSAPLEEAPLEESPQATPYTPFGEIGEDIEPESLKEDQDWLRASSLAYQLRNHKPFEGDAEELSSWGREHMAWFNYNLGATAYMAKQVSEADQLTKEAYLHMIQKFDNTNMSWEGAGNALVPIVADPTTWAGVATVAGVAAKPLASAAAKKGVVEALKYSLGRTGLTAAADGAIVMTADDSMRQSIELSAGASEDYDYVRTAGKAALGATAGAVLGTAADAGLTAAAKLLPKKAQAVPEVDAPPEIDMEKFRSRLKESREGVDAPIVEEGAPEFPRMGDTQVGGGIKIDSIRTGIREYPRTKEDITAFSEDLTEQLKSLNAESADDIVEAIRRSDLTPESWLQFNASVQMASRDKKEELKALFTSSRGLTGEALEAHGQKIAETEKLMNVLDSAESAVGTMAGVMLNSRKFGAPEYKDLTPDKIMEAMEVDRETAVKLFIESINAKTQTKQGQKLIKKYDDASDAALQKGNFKEALAIEAEKNREVGHLSRLGENDASLMHKLTEGAISNVFSATTLMINAVPVMAKTLVVPALKAAVSNPLKKATRAEMMGSYAAMKASHGAAWKAARAAFKYEQAILTRDNERFLESGLSLTGHTGGAIRLIPRLLNMTDEYLSQVNYSSFIAGRTAAEAAESGMARGLGGKALDDFIKEESKRALEGAFKQHSAESVISPIVKKGVNLGYKGEKLAAYVEKEAMIHPERLKAGSDEEALDFVRDLLYKKNFSGEGIASNGAKAYENFVNKHPSVKLVFGQLFFRTPVRVFEEGFRLTPGLQYLAPNFIKDLRGVNGIQRQARAKGEALTSLALTSAIFTLYAEGKITGDGGYDDWRQQRVRQDSHLADPYTVKGEDGETWSYRFFDPVATPMKILVSTFERLDQLSIRQAQGEVIDPSAWEEARAMLTAGTMSIYTAVKDANLFAGIAGTIDAVDALANPEDKTSAFVKYFGEKIRLLTPNTLHKAARARNPSVDEPATIEQMFQAKLLTSWGQQEILTSKSYDHMGRERTVTDIGLLNNIFSTATIEERVKGRSDKELFVDQELDVLQREAGVVFRTPFQHSDTGTLDLRTVPTKDGTKTLYDRWNELYNEYLPVDALYEILSADLPTGTVKHKGPRAVLVAGQMHNYRNIAFKVLMSEQEEVIKRLVKESQKEATSKAGLWDADRKVPPPKFETPW